MAEQKRKEPTFYRVLHRTDKFNPGEHIELERSVEFDRWNVDRSDLAELVKLPLQELQAKRKDGATAEKTIFGKVQVAAEEWVEQAAQTMLLDRAIEYVKTPEVKHTSNEWKRQKDGVWEISNRVYIMRYLMDDAVRVVQINPDENANFVFTNTPKPALRLIKTSSDGSRLGGVHFRIAKIEDGTHYLDRITDDTGEINIPNLEPGVYSVKETATVADHILDLQEYHVELFPGQTSTITIENQVRPNLTIYKKDADTGKPIPDTVFLVKAADGHSVDEIRTDSEGKATLANLLPGVYEVSEKSVPAPWLMDADPQLITLYPSTFSPFPPTRPSRKCRPGFWEWRATLPAGSRSRTPTTTLPPPSPMSWSSFGRKTRSFWMTSPPATSG